MTTSHLDDGLLHELADGELPARELVRVQEHLARCDACRARLEEAHALRREALGLVAALDDAPVAGLAIAASAPPVEVTRPPRRSLGLGHRLAWAATVVLAAGAGYFARRMDVARVADRAGETLVEQPAAAAPAPQAIDSSDRAASDARSAERPAADESASGQRPATPATPRGEAEEQAASPRATRQPVQPAERENRADQPPAAPLAKAVAPDSARDRDALRRRLERSTVSLSEVVVTGAASADSLRAAGEHAPAGAPRRLAARELRDASLRAAPLASLRQAGPDSSVRYRLIEGLTPSRLEVADSVVRIHYTTTYGPVVLEQWPAEDGTIRTRIRAPDAVPPDSLRAWEARIR